MQKINFQDLPSTTTPINATNLNAIQTNAEDAINTLDDKLNLKGSYARCVISNTTTLSNITAWSNVQMPFTSSNFATNDSTNFELNGNLIRCNFSGTVLILRDFSHDFTGELDIVDEFGWFNNYNKRGNSISIKAVNSGDNINFVFAGGASGTLNVYGARLIVVRLS